MKRNLFTCLLLLAVLAASAQIRPKLVVGIAVDQMRWDYLYRFYDEYGNDGFKRMLHEGFSCENCQINYIPSVTAIGHTSLYTGAVPSIHGICGNNFLKDGRMTYCCADSTVQTVGSMTKEGQMSPLNLQVTTIGDELKTATNWQSKVIGISFKDRAAILPAGHSADAAYWFDKHERCFITSTYYMERLPEWVKTFNQGLDRSKQIDDIQYSPYGNQIVKDMAKAAIRNEQLGQRGQTDMLCVSFSCPDIVGHKYGTHHEKTHAQYIELDKQLADFFRYLDQSVGKGQWLAFLSADHGAANSIQQNLEHKIPAGGFYEGEECKTLNSALSEKFSTPEKLARRIFDYKVALDRAAIEKAGLKVCEVKQAVKAHFERNPEVMYVVDMEQAASAPVPAYIREKIINGYNRERSGDIVLILKPQYFGAWKGIGGGTSHGLWNPYDCHIPFVLLGWGVEHGSTARECHITDIAPTITALIHVQMPSGCIGEPVKEVTK